MTHKVLSRVWHNGVQYEVGDSFDISAVAENLRDALIAEGVLEEAEADTDAAEQAKADKAAAADKAQTVKAAAADKAAGA